MSADGFREIRVVFRSRAGDQAWIVDVDPTVPIPELVPELIDTLPIEGGPGDFDVRLDGTVAEPTLVLERKTRRGVGPFRQTD